MNIHILGIAGTMTAPLAVELKRQGHNVSGSDQDKIYPPIKPMLDSNHILINQPLDYQKIDLAIIGAAYKSFKRCLDEFELIKKNKINYISSTEYLATNLCQPNSILVAGSYGKSTISALLVHILTQANFDPSYFTGGQFVDQRPSLKICDNPWSVVEADESINGLDTKAKFLYYPLKYLILTSTDWEHKDSYPTTQDNLQAYKLLIQRIPSDGLLVYNSNHQEVASLAQFSPAPAVAYGNNFVNFATQLIGLHNQENCHAAYTICRQLGIDDEVIKLAIKSFKGIKRRLEIIKSSQDNIFIDDYAQSIPRITQSLSALNFQFPDYKIKVFFEPHASFLQYKSSLVGLNQAFGKASEVVLSKIKFSSKVDPSLRSTAADYRQELGDKLTYLPDYQEILHHYQKTLQPKEILIHFSSGGLEGLNLFNTIIS